MARKKPAQWTMDVVLVCDVTPPSDALREAVDEVCGKDCVIDEDAARPVVSLEADAADAETAVAALNAKAEKLVDLLNRYGCAIESTSRLVDRSVEPDQPEAASLGEGDRDLTS